MGMIDNTLNAQLAQIPRMILKPILERKLKEIGIEPPSAAIDALIDHILSGSSEVFLWDDGGTETQDVSIVPRLIFTDDDHTAIGESLLRVSEALPDIVQNIVDKRSFDLYKAAISRWGMTEGLLRQECDEFREEIDAIWGDGLSLLRLLLQSARSIGEDAARRHRKSKAKTFVNRRFVLGRLHIRACQVADEIITLMENGFADGAMARWRTLHEIDVIATVIEGGDEELARRYINHDVVEVKKQADDYDEKQVPLGYKPISLRERKRIENLYSEAIRHYGQNFRYEYGWASDHLKDKKPDFKKLQDAADQSSMNTYYKLANFNVHAGAHAMFYRLTDLGSNVPIAGRSNAGLVEPGQNTAYTLVRITGAFVGRPKSLDRVSEIGCLVTIRDAIPIAFQRADRKLRRDETRWQRELKRRAAEKRVGRPSMTQ